MKETREKGERGGYRRGVAARGWGVHQDVAAAVVVTVTATIFNTLIEAHAD